MEAGDARGNTGTVSALEHSGETGGSAQVDDGRRRRRRTPSADKV